MRRAVAITILALLAVVLAPELRAQVGTFRASQPSAGHRPSDRLGLLGGQNTRAGGRSTVPGRSSYADGPLAVPTAPDRSYRARRAGGLRTSGMAPLSLSQAGLRGPAPLASRSQQRGSGHTLPKLAGPSGMSAYSHRQRQQGDRRPSLPWAGAPRGPDDADSPDSPPLVDVLALNQLTTSQYAELRLDRLRQSYVRQAHNRFRTGDYAEARSLFKIVATMEQRPGVGQLGVLHACFALRHYGSATAALMPLLRTEVNIFAADVSRLLYADNEKLAEHIAAFRPAITRGDLSAPAMALASYMLWVNGERNEARSAALQAVDLAPPGDAHYRFLLAAIEQADERSTIAEQ
jgi:hypothetical protein